MASNLSNKYPNEFNSLEALSRNLTTVQSEITALQAASTTTWAGVIDVVAAQDKIGLYGATPVTQPTAMTAQLTTITYTAPTTPDYALQDLTDTGGFGFATKDEGNSLLAVVANLQARVAELETKLVALGAVAAAA